MRSFRQRLGRGLLATAFCLSSAGSASVRLPIRVYNQDYLSAGAAVLLIDMQESFVNHMGLSEYNDVVGSQREVLTYCASHGIPVAVIEFLGSGPTAPPLMKTLRDVGRKGTIVRYDKDAFTNPDLEHLLERWTIDRVFLMGTTPVCVGATAADAFVRGYAVATAPDVLARADLNASIDLPREDLMGPYLVWQARHGTVYPDHRSVLR